MPNIVRLSENRYINFDDVRDIYIDLDKELSVTITWRGEEATVDTFDDEDARKIMVFAELFSSLTFYKVSTDVKEPPDELAQLG